MKKTLLSFSALLIGLSMIAQNGTELKLNLEKNKVYRLKSVSEQNVSQTVNGMQQNSSVNQTYVVSIKMVDSKPDMMVVEFRFDTLSTSTNSMGKVVNMTSASEGNVASTETGEVMSSFLNKLSKNALYLKMDYTGKVIDFVNAKMLTDMLLKDTAQITGDAAPVLKTQVMGAMSEKSLISQVETFTHNVPGKAVSKGDKWDITDNINAGGMSLEIVTNYQLKDLVQDNAIVNAESSIKAADNAAPIQYGPATVSYGSLQGMGKSALTLNAKTGLVVKNSNKTHIAGDLAVSVQGMNLQMPMQMDGETNVYAIQ